jgi:hypothetical protein
MEGCLNQDGYLFFLKIIDKINQFQVKNKVRGSVAEIGIHHGKSFIPLLKLCQDKYKGVAIDCFDDQFLNIDKSGKGNYKIFMKNIKRYAGDKKRNLVVEKTDSLKINPQKIISLAKSKIRIFSIDGGHTDFITYSDLKNAYFCLAKGGIIIIDDFLNSEWPGVKKGVEEFFNKEKPDLAPFLYGFNKLYLCRKNFAEKYSNFIKSFIGNAGVTDILGKKCYMPEEGSLFND